MMKKITLKKICFALIIIMGISSTDSMAQKMKVLSYNVLEGMKLDTTAQKDGFVNWIKAQDPDIMIICEACKFTQKRLNELARKWGHPYAVILKEGGYPEAITSKYPIVNIEKVLDNMHHGFIKASVNGYNVIALHLSPFSYEKQREEIQTILQTIASAPSQEKWIIAGDFNTVSPYDKQNYADGARKQVLIEQAQKRPVIDLIVDGDIDYQTQQWILDAGFVDVVYEKNKKFISSAPSLQFPNDKNVCRIDYIFVSKDLAPKVSRAEIVKDDFTNYHSDHYPIVMELKK